MRESLLLDPPKDLSDASPDLVQRTLFSMASSVVNGHVLSLRKQRQRKSDLKVEEKQKFNINLWSPSDNSISTKALGERPSTSGPPSASPNPFVSETFRLSFEVRQWLDSDREEQDNSTVDKSCRHGPYPNLHVWFLEHDVYRLTPARRIWLQKKMMPERQPAIIEPLPMPPRLSVKIPWRGKNIIVRLPPANSFSASTERKKSII